MKHATATALTAILGAAMLGAAPSANADTVTLGDHTYPICHTEDCSDQPGQHGAWWNGTQWYVSLGEHSVPATHIAHGANAWHDTEYIGGYN